MPTDRSDAAPTAVITDAEPGSSEEIDGRQRRYLISMAIRVACFIGLLVTPGPWRWAFLAGAAVIPPVAVLFANISSRPPTRRDWEPEPEPVPAAIERGQVIRGETDDD